MPISATKAAKNKPFIGIDLCTLLSSQGTYALRHGVLTRFQGRPPNLVEGARIDKSVQNPMNLEGEIRFPGLKTLINQGFSSISGARAKDSRREIWGQIEVYGLPNFYCS